MEVLVVPVPQMPQSLFRHDYLVTRFPRYILTKAHLLGGQEQAKQIGNLYQPKQLGGKK